MADRIVAATAWQLSTTLYVGETPVDPTGPATVTITNAAGVEVVSAAAATAVGSDTGVVTYDLANTVAPTVDELTVEWTATVAGSEQTTTTTVEVAGGFHVPLARIRQLPNLSDPERFDESRLREAREWWEALCEQWTGRAWVPRLRSWTFAGDGAASILAPDVLIRSVAYAEVNGTEVTDDVVFDDIGLLILTSGCWSRGTRTSPTPCTVRYVHGADGLPADLEAAAETAIRWRLLAEREGAPARELSVANDVGGTTRFSTPGPDRPTGLLDVDATLNRYRRAPALA